MSKLVNYEIKLSMSEKNRTAAFGYK